MAEKAPAAHGNRLAAITGRMEIRRATVCPDIDRLQERHDQLGLAAIGKVEAGRETAKRTATETRLSIASTPFPKRERAAWNDNFSIQTRRAAAR